MTAPQVYKGEQVVIYRGSGSDLATDIMPLLDVSGQREAFVRKLETLLCVAKPESKSA